jgi:hypothetical protein
MIVMFIGGCLLTGAYGPNAQVFLSVFCFALFFYCEWCGWIMVVPVINLLLDAARGVHSCLPLMLLPLPVHCSVRRGR